VRISRSKMRGRLWLPMCSRSRKPRVVTSAHRSPLRSSSALVATWRERALGGRPKLVPGAAGRAAAGPVLRYVTLELLRALTWSMLTYRRAPHVRQTDHKLELPAGGPVVVSIHWDPHVLLHRG